MGWGDIDDAAIEAAGQLIGVPLRRDRMQCVRTASEDAILHFAWGIGDGNPLWRDPAYGQRSRWKCQLAPPCFLYAVDYTVVAPKLPGVQWIYAGTDWTWFDVIRAGDRFTTEAALISQEVKQGRRFKRWVLQTGEIFYRTTDGSLKARALGRCARTPRRSPSSAASPSNADGPMYTEEELARIEEAILAEGSRGDDPLYWEDVEVGESPRPVVKGPLSIIDIVAWYSATQGAQPYGGAHGDAVRYRRRHDDYHINPRTGAKDAAGRGHLEAETGRDVGMGGIYDVGPQRISWAGQMLTDWIGDHGFLHRLRVDVRAPNLVGDTTWWNGQVTHKWTDDDACFVRLTVTATNQRGEATATGHAVVALPSRRFGPVPLPLARGHDVD